MCTNSTYNSSSMDSACLNCVHALVWHLCCPGSQPIVVEKGLGSWVWDTKGDKYLDMTTGEHMHQLYCFQIELLG
jgi:4-aminobutyrate aminotransferase-like enzyme